MIEWDIVPVYFKCSICGKHDSGHRTTFGESPCIPKGWYLGHILIETLYACSDDCKKELEKQHE
jgi:hypothetical protein